MIKRSLRLLMASESTIAELKALLVQERQLRGDTERAKDELQHQLNLQFVSGFETPTGLAGCRRSGRGASQGYVPEEHDALLPALLRSLAGQLATELAPLRNREQLRHLLNLYITHCINVSPAAVLGTEMDVKAAIAHAKAGATDMLHLQRDDFARAVFLANGLSAAAVGSHVQYGRDLLDAMSPAEYDKWADLDLKLEGAFALEYLRFNPGALLDGTAATFVSKQFVGVFDSVDEALDAGAAFSDRLGFQYAIFVKLSTQLRSEHGRALLYQ